jgi:chemotaxis protein MotB
VAGDTPIVIKRIKKGDHAHHGGAWKVAYADFVTAMMAFFLLMWLINTTTPEQKRGIADYFAPQSIAQTLSGSGGILGGKVMGQESARAGGSVSVLQNNSPPAPANQSHSSQSASRQGGTSQSQGSGSDSRSQSGDATDNANSSSQDGEFAHAAEAIHQSIKDNPDLAALSRQVLVDQTPEGLRIQLVDQDGRPMFEQGTAEPMPYTKRLLEVVAKIIDRLPNRVSISGHTQAAPLRGPGGMTNWDLSSARANAGRAVLAAAGLGSDRIYEVAGKAGSEPLLPEDPNASANRRLSIVLLREAPPAPIGRQL